MGDNKISVSDLSSSLKHFGWADYLVFLLMLVICAFIGVYFGFWERAKRKRASKLEEYRGSIEALNYLVGGRKMQVLPVAMSLVASWISGIALLGTSTEVYLFGSQFAFTLVSCVLSGFVGVYAILPVMHGLQLTSTYEYLEFRFDKRIRLVGSILFTLGTIIWLPIVIFVPALAFNQVTGINIHIITPIVSIVCIFYTCIGGLKAVVWTDVTQILVMAGSVVLVAIKGTHEIGGFQVLWERNMNSGRLEFPELSFDPTVRYSVFSVYAGGVFYWIQQGMCNQVMMQRYLSLPTLRDARIALVLFTFGILFILGCCIYNGLLMYAIYHDCDPITTKLAKAKDQLMPLLVMQLFGQYPGMSGLFVAGVFSAALSSLSTGLNCLSAIVLEDFCKPYVKSPLTERQIAIIMRSVVVVCGAICVGLVFVVERMGTVLQLSASLGSIVAGPTFGIFLTGICIPWINGKSTLVGSVISLVVVGWTCLKAQAAIALGTLTYVEKPTSIIGCAYSFESSETLWNATTTALPDVEEKHFYHISYLLYVLLGAGTTILASLIVSCVLGFQDPRDLDPKVIAPFMRKFIKQREYLSVQPDIKERESIIRAYDNIVEKTKR